MEYLVYFLLGLVTMCTQSIVCFPIPEENDNSLNLTNSEIEQGFLNFLKQLNQSKDLNAGSQTAKSGMETTTSYHSNQSYSLTTGPDDPAMLAFIEKLMAAYSGQQNDHFASTQSTPSLAPLSVTSHAIDKTSLETDTQETGTFDERPHLQNTTTPIKTTSFEKGLDLQETSQMAQIMETEKISTTYSNNQSDYVIIFCVVFSVIVLTLLLSAATCVFYRKYKARKNMMMLNKDFNRWDPQLLRPNQKQIDAFIFGTPIPTVSEMMKY